MIFPTIYSTLDPAALATVISSRYELGSCTAQLLVRGVSDTYLLQSPPGHRGNRFILRIYRSTHRSLENILAEVKLLTALYDAGVRVSYPLPDQSGEFVQAFNAAEGIRHGVLFSYAPGDAVHLLTPAQLRALGREMARFHRVSASISPVGERWTYNTFTTPTEPMQRVAHVFASLPDELTWRLHVTNRARQELEAMNPADFSSGYIHYDFLPKNFHFDDDDITLFDFDFFGQGWLVNDVMTFWTHLCLDVQFNRMTQTQADEAFAILMNAYHSERSFRNDELRALPALSVRWWCFYMGFHATHDQFAALVQPAHLKMRTALIRQVVETNYLRFGNL